MINFEKEWNQNLRLLKFEIIEQSIIFEFSTFDDALTTVTGPLADINSSAHMFFAWHCCFEQFTPQSANTVADHRLLPSCLRSSMELLPRVKL